MNLLEEFRAIRTGNPFTIGGKTAYHHDKKIGIIMIPKCGIQSIKAAVMLDRDDFIYGSSEDAYLGHNYVAMVRDPVKRWISGMATFVAVRQTNSFISEETAKKFMEDSEVLKSAFANVVHDSHTKSQTLYIQPVKDRVVLFTVENREAFYSWLKYNGLDIKAYNLHGAKDAPDGSVVKVVYAQLEEAIKVQGRTEMIEKFYADDRVLYNSVRDKENK